MALADQAWLENDRRLGIEPARARKPPVLRAAHEVRAHLPATVVETQVLLDGLALLARGAPELLGEGTVVVPAGLGARKPRAS